MGRACAGQSSGTSNWMLHVGCIPYGMALRTAQGASDVSTSHWLATRCAGSQPQCAAAMFGTPSVTA